MNDKLSQETLFEMKDESKAGPVTCLGFTFENDEIRRAYFTEELRKKLPDLKKIEGFPIGNDEDILALSDPPYYTACPNPWLTELVAEFKKEGLYFDDAERESRPFVYDVSEGKNDPIYNAHTYHTKVPYKAIMHYLLHYTKPNDVVLDGFSGSGMTGIASHFCGDMSVVNSLGYRVADNGEIYDTEGKKISALGKRLCILNDLSPMASYISKSFNLTYDEKLFEIEGKRILHEVQQEFGWMYETTHQVNGSVIGTGTINYVVWSDVYICPSCSEELIFDADRDDSSSKIRGQFECNHCGAVLSKRGLERVWETIFHPKLNETLQVAKQVPVKINYTYKKKRFEKAPSNDDLNKLDVINSLQNDHWVPTEKLPIGFNTNQPVKSHGIKYPELFYTRRNLLIISLLREKSRMSKSPLVTFWLNSIDHGISKRVKHGNWSFPMSTLSGTLYMPSLSRENNPLYFYETKLMKQVSVIKQLSTIRNIITTQSSTSFLIDDNSIDYIFIDPPFGSNLMYSELNFVLESWMKVRTNTKTEAIVNTVVEKDIDHYKKMLVNCFHEFYRVLKPGRWITIEFSNSQSSIWNAIQETIQRAGFIIANVSVLDKQIGSFKAVTSTVAVKQDLVISAYKPKQSIDEILVLNDPKTSVWGFVKQHLEQLPIFINQDGLSEVIIERTPRILFDRMVAYHVQNGYSVPISSAEFQAGIEQMFPMRDGMAFLETQVAEYDKKRMMVKEFSQMSLFVSDENSAIEWIRQQLMKKPQTRQELHPKYMKEIQHISKHELLPELDALLEQNFLRYDGVENVPSQIHTYLSTDYKDLRNLNKYDPALKLKAKDRWYVPDPNKQADLEKLREKSLLREFETYRDELVGNRKKLKQFRTEAIRAGFKNAWGEKDYQTIVTIGERLPENVLQEDDKLLMYYDNAQIRLGL